MKVAIEGSTINLDALLQVADLVSSGGQAKMLIVDGQVQVNQQVETRRKKKIRVGDVVQVQGFDQEIIPVKKKTEDHENTRP